MPGGGRIMVSRQTVRDILAREGIRPRKADGQNFLVDANILGLIVREADFESGQQVIEVGAGLGALTQELAVRCGRVFAFESDRGLFRVLQRELGGVPDLTLMHADALAFDFSDLWEGDPPPDVKMVSNLPYSIAATLLVKSLQQYPWISEYLVMVQSEVADRLISPPGRKSYSAATVKVGARADVETVATISRHCFIPRPRVDSSLVRIRRDPELARRACPPDGLGAGLFDRLVSAAFSQRRKKLVNSLVSAGITGLDKSHLVSVLTESGLDADRRPEELSVEDFINLSEAIDR